MSQGSSESLAGKFMASCGKAPRCWKASWAGKGNRVGWVGGLLSLRKPKAGTVRLKPSTWFLTRGLRGAAESTSFSVSSWDQVFPCLSFPGDLGTSYSPSAAAAGSHHAPSRICSV